MGKSRIFIHFFIEQIEILIGFFEKNIVKLIKLVHNYTNVGIHNVIIVPKEGRMEDIMKKLNRLIALALTVCMMAALTACGSVPENTVFSVDDLCGKKIGVQLGTTGDIYASDYEDLESGVFPEGYAGEASVIERFNKGNDAVQALKQGKVDCVIIDSQPAQAFVEKNDDLMILEEEFALE